MYFGSVLELEEAGSADGSCARMEGKGVSWFR